MSQLTNMPSTEELELLVGQVLGECQDCLDRGEPLDIEAYARRYPQIAPLLRQMLPALQLMRKPPGGAPAAVPAPELALPAVLGDYRLLREIGRGGMGVVYEAVQEPLGRHVALKVLPFRPGMDPLLLERFRRETRAVARLHHSNIVPVFGVGEQDGTHYYAMQLIQGRSLDAVLRQLRSLKEPASGQAARAGSGPTLPLLSDLARQLLNDRFRVAPAPLQDPAHTESSPSADRVLCMSPGDLQAAPGTAHTAMSLFLGVEAAQPLPGESSPAGSQSISVQHRLSPRVAVGPFLPYCQAVARLGVQVAEALAYAHGEGIVHRDIKPSNLLLDARGTVWLTDFGLAKAEGMENLTHTGDVVGTLRYMPPERFLGHSDGRSDLYSLGLTLYELLTLRPAFDNPDRTQLLRQLAYEQPPRPRKLDPRIPRDLETIVLKTMAKEPGHRYPSAEALAEDLRRFLADRPIAARRVRRAEQVWRWCRRNPAVAVPTALALVLFLVGFPAVAILWRQAEHNLGVAQSQRQRAEANFRWAQEAVDEMLTQVGAGLADVPQMEPVRQQLLQKALRLHQEFLGEKADDPAVQLEAARAFRRMADIQDLLGQHAQALEALGAGIALLQQPAPAPQVEAEQQQELARAFHQLGTLRAFTKHYQEAERDYRQALAIYEKRLAAFPENMQVRLQAAVTFHQLGITFQSAQRFAEAEAAYEQSLAQLSGSGAEHRRQRANTLNSLGSLRRKRNQFGEALAAYREAQGLLEALVPESPRRDLHEELAAIYLSQANLFGSAWFRRGGTFFVDEQRAARAANLRALESYRRLAKDFPNVPKYRERLAACHFTLGYVSKKVLEAKGRGKPVDTEVRPDDALDAYRKALAGYQELVNEFPDAPSHRHEVAKVYHHLGELLRWMKRLEEAEQASSQAHALYEQLVQDFPHEADYHNGLGLAAGCLAVQQRDRGRLAEAVRLSREALGHLRTALVANPEDEDYQEYLQREYNFLALTLLALKDHAGAARAADEMHSSFPQAWQPPYLAVRFLARCIPVAEGDPELPEAKRWEVVRAYVGRSVELLRAASARRGADPTALAEALQVERHFDPLRTFPEFQRLLTELPDQPKPPPR